MDKEQIKKDTDKTVEDMKEKVKDFANLDMLENVIANNFLEFKYKETEYKVSKPTYNQKLEANQRRIEKYTELLKAVDDQGKPKYMSESDLIALYKKRGINVNELSAQYDLLDKNRKSVQFQLGKAIKEKKPENELKILQDKIVETYKKQQELMMRRAVLLDSSIESQVNVYTSTYLAYLITEKKVEGKWKKAWNNYDKFISLDEALVNKVVLHASMVFRNEADLI